MSASTCRKGAQQVEKRHMGPPPSPTTHLCEAKSTQLGRWGRGSMGARRGTRANGRGVVQRRRGRCEQTAPTLFARLLNGTTRPRRFFPPHVAPSPRRGCPRGSGSRAAPWRGTRARVMRPYRSWVCMRKTRKPRHFESTGPAPRVRPRPPKHR